MLSFADWLFRTFQKFCSYAICICSSTILQSSYRSGYFMQHRYKLLHEELHWLDVPERIHYKLGVTVHRCLQYKAPEYLVDCCTPVSDIPSRRRLRSATRHHLTVPRYRLSTGRRSSGLLCRWSNGLQRSLPGSLRDPALSSNSFRQSMKTNLFRRYHSADTAQ